MVAFNWPVILKPSDFGYSYISSDTSGGASLGGNEQFVSSPGQRWAASMTLPIVDNAGVLALRTLRTQLQGRANWVLLPNFDGLRLSWPIEATTGRRITPKVGRQIEGTYGLEGTGFGQLGIPLASEIQADLGAAVEVGDTTALISVSQGGAPKPGQQFGLASRLYELASVAVDEVREEGVIYAVEFRPRIRVAKPLNEPVLFTRPVCVMRCLNLDDQTKKFDRLRFAELDLEFIEYF